VTVIDQMAPLQAELRERLGTVFAFLGDEFYIRAGRSIPSRSHYRIVRSAGADEDTYPQIEDGVGMVRQFFEQHARRMRQLAARRKRGEFTEADAWRINGTIATGLLFYPMLNEALTGLNERFGTRLHAVTVENVFFGPEVTVAGLLSGIDFLGAREEFTGEFLVVPPDSYRRHDLRFLDGMTVGELAGELALPIKRTWHEVLGLPEPKIDRHTPILSHDYGSVTSVST